MKENKVPEIKPTKLEIIVGIAIIIGFILTFIIALCLTILLVKFTIWRIFN